DDGPIDIACQILAADYKKSTLQVYIVFVKHCVSSRGSLDIICRHWALPLKEASPGSRTADDSASTFPSWIGLAADSPFGPPSLFTGRINGDSLVGQPGYQIYNASGGRPASVLFGQVNHATD